MSYLREIEAQLNQRDFPKLLQLWHEYCADDHIDPDEMCAILHAVKVSDFARPFGTYVEQAMPLWKTLTDINDAYKVFRLIVDLQTSQNPELADLTYEILKKIHGEDPLFQERLRLIGLRTRDQFQGAISYYDLLKHMQKGKFVYHAGGWGVGEIVELSTIREQVAVEFEHVTGRKYLTFTNAFKAVEPISEDHFRVQRFAFADELEAKALGDPVHVIKILLRDFGPLTASEIKDEMCVLVIQEKNWVKWWQNTRAKLKKDPIIETPNSPRDPFVLRQAPLTQEKRLEQAIGTQTNLNEIIRTAYNFVRDLPADPQSHEIKQSLQNTFLEHLEHSDLTQTQRLEIYLLLEHMFGYSGAIDQIHAMIKDLDNVPDVVDDIEVLALKKRALVFARELRDDWPEIFLALFIQPQQSMLRDYLLKELVDSPAKETLKAKLNELVNSPSTNFELYVWYFQKLMNAKDETIPFADKEGRLRFFEGFLILFSFLESRSEVRDLLKKMYGMMTANRYALVRNILSHTSIDFAKEFLLLIAKCQTFTDHDIKILRSLAEVVHPSLARKKTVDPYADILWTTEEGYRSVVDRMHNIATVEMIENAREIEAARAHGDLRENSEFKFAQERRARLQEELKRLSEQIKQARILTPEDIDTSSVGIGTVVTLKDPEGNTLTYTLLGPWEADADQNILFYKSKLAQMLTGLKIGDHFQFKGIDRDWEVVGCHSFFDKKAVKDTN